jgi:hypothetical protein
MTDQLYCPDETRKSLVRAENQLNGIDYLEVLDDEAPAGSPPQQTVLVRCFRSVAGLDKKNVRVDGGVRISPVRVLWAYPASTMPAAQLSAEAGLQAYLAALPNPERVLVVRTDSRGDFSTYSLHLVLSPTRTDEPPTGFDRRLSSLEFSFKVDCPSEFDCKEVQACPEPEWPVPQINYLTKDYASFRRLMLDRLAVIMPDWQERNPADLGIAFVELLAYAADNLSYFQDAVATEAYLGTARRRVSVRRHARMIDYFMHDGANARTWVCLEVNQDLSGSSDNPVLPSSTLFVAREEPDNVASSPSDQPQQTITGAPIVFEPLHTLALLKVKRNAIPFYTWGDPRCCLPRGATRATLHGSAADLELKEGDVLIFEEVLGPESRLEVDADPAHRHAVRLNGPPRERTDLHNDEKVLEISWHMEDALPFSLCLWRFGEGSSKDKHVSVARGNVVLADHGLTLKDEELRPALVPEGRSYRPHLQRDGLTQGMPYDDERARRAPACKATTLDLRRVMPRVSLKGEIQEWTPQRDLLNSSRFAPEFVVEMESDGQAYLRFGDGVLGKRPTPGSRFAATYRIGNGAAGNVGPETLTRMFPTVSGVSRVRNPLSATGGTDPEPIEKVRLYAPQAFRTQERAVTEADYAAVAQRHPEVQRAAATRRWTGSWYTMFVTVDRKGGLPVDTAFEEKLRSFLERFRMAGYDLEIDAPRFVSLDVALRVCVAPGYLRSDADRALLESFSNEDLPAGRRGFFHPDNFTFGQPLYLSRVVAAAMEVPGVAWVEPLRFHRLGREPDDELEEGRIAFDRLEVARLDDDPNAPENGKLEFELEGGL